MHGEERGSRVSAGHKKVKVSSYVSLHQILRRKALCPLGPHLAAILFVRPFFRQVHYMRPLLPSHAHGEEEAEVVAGIADRTGEEYRVLKVKQMIKMTVGKAGPGGKAALERAFRLADKDASGQLSFDELACVPPSVPPFA